ncbi:MAG: HEPN domain-containing protein [Deltaproteobacteria bacterium]|nr:HEPN domain-containing protein [Deltaproteobacteria bacterium]
MKPLENPTLKLVSAWLRKADSDMKLAEHLFSEGADFPNAIALHSQQTAEKYLKAFLTYHQKAFPKTHDLDVLLDLIETIDPNLALSLRDVIILTPYGVELRYPGDYPEPTTGMAEEAVELARKVKNAILKSSSLSALLGQPGDY